MPPAIRSKVGHSEREHAVQVLPNKHVIVKLVLHPSRKGLLDVLKGFARVLPCRCEAVHDTHGFRKVVRRLVDRPKMLKKNTFSKNGGPAKNYGKSPAISRIEEVLRESCISITHRRFQQSQLVWRRKYGILTLANVMRQLQLLMSLTRIFSFNSHQIMTSSCFYPRSLSSRFSPFFPLSFSL